MNLGNQTNISPHCLQLYAVETTEIFLEFLGQIIPLKQQHNAAHLWEPNCLCLKMLGFSLLFYISVEIFEYH